MMKTTYLRPDESLLRLTAVSAALILLSGSLFAQRMHVSDSPPGSGMQGLIGEPPDVSTWPHPAAPDGNPYPRSTASIAELRRRANKEHLGKVLFWEEQVGIDNTMACGTCHDTAAGGADGRAPLFQHPTNGTFSSAGVIQQAVNPLTGTIDYGFQVAPTTTIDREVESIIAPPMIAAYIFNELFWDMRAGPTFDFEGGGTIPNFDDWAACEQLPTGPPLSPIEMGHEALTWSSGTLQKKIGSSFPMALCDPDPAKMPTAFRKAVEQGITYDKWFEKVFSADPDPILAAGSGVTRERFAAANAHYMRTLIPDQAPIDLGTMTADQQAGFAKFQSVGCSGCHSVGFSIALSTPGGGFVDPFDAPLSNGQFRDVRGISVKTPSLRNVGLKHRFFTDGLVDNLPDLLAFYKVRFGFALTVIEEGQFTDFLVHALTDPRVALRLAPFDKPELASERPEHAFEGNEFGAAVSGLSTPEIIANAPAFLPPTGFPQHFKIGVANCIPGATATLGVLVPPSTTIKLLPPVTVNARGFATVHVKIPLDSVGIDSVQTFSARWFVTDAGAPSGLAQSNSARWTPFNFFD